MEFVLQTKDDEGNVIMGKDGNPVLTRPHEHRPLNDQWMKVVVVQMLNCLNETTQPSLIWIPGKPLEDLYYDQDKEDIQEEHCCANVHEWNVEKHVNSQYRGYHIGGSHKISAKKSIVLNPDIPSFPGFQLELSTILVGDVPIEDLQFMARHHNIDADFRKKASSYDKLVSFHGTWLRAGSPGHPSKDLKITAMQDMGMTVEDTAESRNNEWIWQLAQQDDTCWELLEKYLKLYKHGNAKGQAISTKRKLQAEEATTDKYVPLYLLLCILLDFFLWPNYLIWPKQHALNFSNLKNLLLCICFGQIT